MERSVEIREGINSFESCEIKKSVSTLQKKLLTTNPHI
jgi:hypothetical protein